MGRAQRGEHEHPRPSVVGHPLWARALPWEHRKPRKASLGHCRAGTFEPAVGRVQGYGVALARSSVGGHVLPRAFQIVLTQHCPAQSLGVRAQFAERAGPGQDCCGMGRPPLRSGCHHHGWARRSTWHRWSGSAQGGHNAARPRAPMFVTCAWGLYVYMYATVPSDHVDHINSGIITSERPRRVVTQALSDQYLWARGPTLQREGQKNTP